MFDPFHRQLHHSRHLFMAGRLRGGHGFGRFSGGFLGRDRDGEGFRSGRKLASADLQLLILALLAETPNHGYDLIKALEHRSNGFYTPSPGMIYPALTYLDEIGYATIVAEGTKKQYHITERGREHLEEHRERVDMILAQLERIGRKMADVRRVFSGDDDSDFSGKEGPESAERGTHKGVVLARHALKRALSQKRECSPEEARRIAEILTQAAAKISEE